MSFHHVAHLRGDGRTLHLYGREPVQADLDAPAPARGPGQPHLRWHPLRGEWVVYAAHRQDRTFQPPPAWDPLRPSADPEAPTEVPHGNWEIAVFENRFPALRADAVEAPPLIVPSAPADGVCEVVVYGPEPGGSLGELPLARIELLVAVWADRIRDLATRPNLRYVFPFENRGAVVGVTLPHPHGQIYAYPFVPPIPARALELQRAHLQRHGRGLLEDLLRSELADGRRILYSGDHVVAWVPVCARYAYEVWIAPRSPVPTLADLGSAQQQDLARALKTVLLKYDRLWGEPFPYLLTVHQAPVDGVPHPEAHAHLELYPPLRAPGRLKYLAGTELGAGSFAADTLPEDKAAELRAVEVDVD